MSRSDCSALLESVMPQKIYDKKEKGIEEVLIN